MVLYRVIMQWVLVLFLNLSFGYVQGQEVVKLEVDVHGTFMTTRKGRNISAYLGIPYAEPPIGPLRFQSPVLWKKRDRPIRADKYANQCPQMNNGVMVGDEDCLFLNVYTPKVNPDKPYPVMVYLHGGNFVGGSANDARPDYLMDKDIVLVTVNYRLGVLGFLSTGDAAAPGNFGLKDQALALKWVRMNIFPFGGDPNQVTIFGQDAGAVSTVCLAISDASKDLFDQYIAQSGTPLAWWGFADDFHDHYPKWSGLLGNYVKCPPGNTFELVECLQSLNTSTLVDSDDIFNESLWKYRTWSPTTEPQDLEGTLLTHAPAELAIFKEGWIKDCPAIIGQVSDEGLLFTEQLKANNTVYDYFKKNLDAFLVQLTDNVAGDGHPEQTAQKVKKFYFDSVDINDKETFIRNLTNVITDSSFTFPTGLQVWMMEELTAPYYVYKFEYRSSYNKTSIPSGKNDNHEVGHGDDLQFIFPRNNANNQLSASDEKMIDVMVDFWTSFATTGVPTSKSISNPNMWENFKTQERSLEIGKDSDPTAMNYGKPLDDRRFLFWNQITIGQLFESLADPS